MARQTECTRNGRCEGCDGVSGFHAIVIVKVTVEVQCPETSLQYYMGVHSNQRT